MNRVVLSLATTLAALASLTAPAVVLADLPTQVNGSVVPSLAPMLQPVIPAIVNIMATGRSVLGEDPFSENAPPSSEEEGETSLKSKHKEFVSAGSGVIVDAKEGYILTNAHLIEKAKSVTVTLNDGRHFKAKLIGSDPDSDVAVLKIEATDLVALPLGDSDKLQVGDFVVAIGNPFDLNQTVTSGIVSAVERTDLRIEGYENFIQTDASINPGNSGGALVNLKGELVGINTAILSPYGGNVGIGFAIPTNMAKIIMDQLVQYGNLGRGMVGVMIQTLTPELANAIGQPTAKGAVVTNVTPHSPASKVGIQTGDIIQKINGNAVVTAGQVRNNIGLQRANSKFEIEFLRQNKTMKVSLTSVDPEAYVKDNHAQNPFFYGVVMKDFDAQVPSFGRVTGVQALQLADNSPAWQAGLRPGDVVLSINNKPAENLTNLLTIANQEKSQVLLNIFRTNGSMFIVVKKSA